MRSALRIVIVAASLLGAPTTRAQQLGTISFPTSGATAAQAEFVRGVLYLHNFEYTSAAEAFRRAQALDSRFAMAYWGEALTHTHQVWNEQNLESARAVLLRLGPTPRARLAAAPTARERAYVASVDALYGDGPKAQRDTLYASAMERMTRDWPDDDEASVLYATALFGLTQGVRDVPVYMRAGAIAQDVFGRNSAHPGAAHMLIHAFDDPVHAPLGLHAARMYSRIAPAAAHAQHMTTHIFLALGMWDEVAAQNLIAAGADSSRWQPGHYTHWLLYAYLQQGRYEAAQALLSSLAAHAAGRAQARGPLANFRARYVMETAQWDSREAMSLDEDVGVAGEGGYDYSTFAAGYAAAKRGDRTRAAALLERYTRTNSITAFKPGASGRDVVPLILELSLRAEFARQDSKPDSAIAFLRRATALEDGMPAEFGPPAVVAPSHELLGALLFEVGQTDEASVQYERALELQPGRSAALLGNARAQLARGRTVSARRAYRQLMQNWSAADSGLAGIAEARTRALAPGM